MGYDLHITRREFWADDDSRTITLDEWLVYVDSDGEIEPDPDNPGLENKVFAGHPERPPLWWSNTGEVFTKNPDSLMIAKLVQIAGALKARVQGDDGEIYGLDLDDPTRATQP